MFKFQTKFFVPLLDKIFLFLYLQDTDLLVGKSVNVFGFEIILYDCDRFTREYFERVYHIIQSQRLDKPSSYLENLRRNHANQAHRDQSPQDDAFDYAKFLKYDKASLRFTAKMISNIPENLLRSFIISYHLSDDTISVYEKTDRNAGFKVTNLFF